MDWTLGFQEIMVLSLREIFYHRFKLFTQIEGKEKKEKGSLLEYIGSSYQHVN